MRLPPAREATVDGRPLYVFDGLAPAQETVGLQRFLEEDALPGASSADGTQAARLLEFDTTEPQEGSFQRWSTTLAAALFGEVELEHCHVKRVQVAADGWTDGDGASGRSRDGVVAMWFLCTVWSGDRGGETLFLDDAGEAMVCVSPRPGRLVLFDSSTARYHLAPRGAAPGSCFTLEYRFTRSAPRESRVLDGRSR